MRRSPGMSPPRVPRRAPLHEALERSPQVSLGEDVVRNRVEHVVGIERRQALTAVPATVPMRLIC